MGCRDMLNRHLLLSRLPRRHDILTKESPHTQRYLPIRARACDTLKSGARERQRQTNKTRGKIDAQKEGFQRGQKE